MALSASRLTSKIRRRSAFMADPFKHPTSGIYYLRRKVPLELRPALGHEYKRSLQTRDPEQAKHEFARAWVQSDEAFAAAGAELRGVAAISAFDAQQLAARWFRAEQERLERTGQFTKMLVEGPGGAWEHAGRREEWQTFISLRDAVVQGEEPPDGDWAALVAPHIKAALRAANLPMPVADTPSALVLQRAFEEHVYKLSDWALRRHDGERVPLGQDVAPLALLAVEQPKAAEAPKRTLGELFGAYKDEKLLNDGDTRSTRKSIKTFLATLERFTELMGDLDIRQINREAVNRFRGELARLPAKGEGTRNLTAPQLIAKAEAEGLPRLSEPTIRNHLRALSAVLSHGVRLQWLVENAVIAGGAGRMAAKAATRKVAASRRRKDYSRGELRTIFASPIFSNPDGPLPLAKFGKAWQWLPLLLYYTGARREELAQLQVSDVRRSEDGIWHLSILAVEGEDDGDRGVKTESSRRLIPLHADLVRRQFLDYVQSLPKDGQLFPGLTPNPAGYYGANFGKHWGVYLRDVVKLDSPASPSHGFRHAFKTLCRSVGIPEDVHDAITGHVGKGGVARDYGSMPLMRMADALNALPCIDALHMPTPAL